MKTQSKELIFLSESLLSVLDQIRILKNKEEQYKTELKNKCGLGVLEAGNVIIFIEQKNRSTLDRAKLEKELGTEYLKDFFKDTGFIQVNVKKKVGVR